MKEKIVLYLVTFYGIPDWEEGQTTHFCTRRYLFSTMKKAVAFVKHRTSSPEWMTHPAHLDSPMTFRLKRGFSSNRYNIVTLTVDEVNDEANYPNEACPTI